MLLVLVSTSANRLTLTLSDNFHTIICGSSHKHHRQAKSWRDKPFPLFERLEYIFGKNRANGSTAYIKECITKDEENMEVDDHSENGVGNFSPMSVNQADSNQPINQPQPTNSSKKRSRSGDPIVRSMEKFTIVFKETIESSMENFSKY